jgi:ADP-heptose:LPS heptosyltransferase
MNTFESIEARVAYYNAKIDVINRALGKEKNKAYAQRQRNLILFLHAEKHAHLQTIAELNALLPGSTGQRVNDGFVDFSRELTVNSIDPNAPERGRVKTGERIYRILTWGGIGDTLLLTPAIRSLKQQYPDCKIYVYYQHKLHMEVLLHNKYVDRLQYWGALTRFFNYILLRFGFREMIQPVYGSLVPGLAYRAHASEIVGEMLGVKIDSVRPDCFLTMKEETEAKKMVEGYPNPVSIQVTPKSSSNKRWTTENWERLVLNNPQYTFLQLGSSNDEFIQGAIDMRGKTSLRQAFGIVKESKAFVGVESVLGHAAAAFQTPAVVLFGPTTPTVWGYSTSKNLYSPPSCSPCVDILVRSDCPYERSCMSNITVSDVERALSSLMTPEPNNEESLDLAERLGLQIR